MEAPSFRSRTGLLAASRPERPRERAEKLIEELFSRADPAFLSSAISREEGRFLADLASRADVRTTIEIGCANGISGLYICSALAEKSNPSHTAIDPFQSAWFGNRGADNIRQAGFDFFHLIEERSEHALPRLLENGATYDMALIDGLHTADQTMVDFYYLDRLLRVGGIMVFDDVNSVAVNKIVRYAATYPNYSVIATSGRRGLRRRLINGIKQMLSIASWPARKLLGEPLVREFADVSLVNASLLWSIDSCTMVALCKTGSYDRDTNWYRGI
jgi:predicted O-methyltransferase YrrM